MRVVVTIALDDDALSLTVDEDLDVVDSEVDGPVTDAPTTD